MSNHKFRWRMNWIGASEQGDRARLPLGDEFREQLESNFLVIRRILVVVPGALSPRAASSSRFLLRKYNQARTGYRRGTASRSGKERRRVVR